MKMTINKILLLFFFMLGSCSTLSAQDKFKVNGIVRDKDNAALPWASVFLTDSVQNVISNAVCDDNGGFSLAAPKGDYIFGVSSVGYEAFSQPVDISADTNLGVITLQSGSVELQTVVVQGRAMKVRSQKGGFSVDVADINSNYNNAYDLMHCIPQITVKEEELAVAGKKNIVAQIGKVVQRVSASELPAVLKEYDAKLIERVEVLRQPPLRYDRDGNTAMIILHTSSMFEKYFGGLIGTELMKGTHHNYRYGGYATLMYNAGNLFFSVSPSYNANGSYSRENTDYNYANSVYNILTPAQGDNIYCGIRSTLQWSYSENGMVGITGTLNKRMIENEFYSYERTVPKSVEDVDADNDHYELFKTPKGSLTAYTEQTFGKRKNKAWLELSYYNYKETQLNNFTGKKAENQQEYFTYTDDDLLKVSGIGANNDYSLKLDDEGNFLFDFGLKFMKNRTRKDRAHTQWMTGNDGETYQQKDNFRLDELSFAPYVSATLQISKSVWCRTGLITDITSRRNDNGEGWQPYKSFVTWLPSLHTTFTLSPAHQLSLTFNSSVEQPKYSQLNPFEWRVGKKSFDFGNTELSPEKHYNSMVAYTYKGSLELARVIEFGSDIISPVTTINNQGNIITRQENAQNSMMAGLTASYWYSKLSWLSASFSAKGGYSRYTSDNPLLDPKATGWEWELNGYAKFIFNKKRTFTGYLSGYYTGKQKTTVSILDPQYGIGAGLSCYLLKRKLSMTLAGINLISAPYKGHCDRDGYTITFNNRYNYHTLYFSVSYKFFNSDDKAVRRSTSANEVERRF